MPTLLSGLKGRSGHHRSICTKSFTVLLVMPYVFDTNVELDNVLAMLASHMIPVPIYFRWRPQLTDPDDEMVLEWAKCW